MKKIILLFTIIFLLFSSCATWHENWAREEGWLPPDQLPEVSPPEQRQPLPHPDIPELVLPDPLPTDEQGNEYIPQRILMEHVLILDGTVEKFQYLVEIYEREYLGIDVGNTKFQGKTLEQLKNEYRLLLGLENSEENTENE